MAAPAATVTRAVAPEQASEAAIRSALAAQGLAPYAWSNGPGDRYPPHTHGYHKVLYCVRGSITFEMAGGDVALRPGDRLDLPAGVTHGALVGPQGCLCLEAHA